MKILLLSILLLTSASAAPIVYDGRASFALSNQDLHSSIGPYSTVVRGSKDASDYTTLLGHLIPPTPLWNDPSQDSEQVISIKIDNSSVFVPGGDTAAPQYGFRRTELIAQLNEGSSTLDALMEVNTTVFHFSILQDDSKPLNYSHEYQIVFIEPNDGSHVFGIQLGSPFTDPTGMLPSTHAHDFKVLDHNLNILFKTPFHGCIWHNFAIQVDWNKLTLAVFYSKGSESLKLVAPAVPNVGVAAGPAGQGDFHFGVLKLPLVNPYDSPANCGDVVHYGIQEGTTEGLLYSGVFVESTTGCVSLKSGQVCS